MSIRRWHLWHPWHLIRRWHLWHPYEVKNNGGSTALHTAAFLCHAEIVNALLEKGADQNARNNAGATAFDSVSGPFDDVKPIYDRLLTVLGPYGLELNYDFIKETRPKIAEILRAE